ncbi:MAG: hypothetical protein H7062_06730 [Candidatus Saccharimonas sp.]|nr:hypothetical protein [Planctomycetaceae bacterium]
MSVCFSPDGRRIASGSRDQTVRVWDAQSGAELALLRGHEDTVISVCLSPDGRRIVSDSWDMTVRVWDAETWECLEVIAGFGDVVAIAAGVPLRAMTRGLGTVIEDAASGRPIASFPVALSFISTHPSGRQWAGAAANHLYLITLEGPANEPPA